MLNNEELCEYILARVKIVDEAGQQYGLQSNFNMVFEKSNFPRNSLFCYMENDTYHYVNLNYAVHSADWEICIDTKDLVEITYCALWQHISGLAMCYAEKLFGVVNHVSEVHRRIVDSFFCEMYAALGEEYLQYAIQALKVTSPNYLRESVRIGKLPVVLASHEDITDKT